MDNVKERQADTATAAAKVTPGQTDDSMNEMAPPPPPPPPPPEVTMSYAHHSVARTIFGLISSLSAQ